ncbi:MAG: MATE family efflux transporter [Treponema sp.]|nr:MATE family efflux transporter [Treponema sp.]
MDTFERMTTEPVEKLVCQMAVPTITIMLVSALYNMADTYFVGSLGTSATAAVGVSFSLMALIQAVGFFFGHGAGNYIARALGAQNSQDAAKMAATGFCTAFSIGLVMTVSGTVWLAPLARVLGATDTSLPYTCEYLRFILLAAPFMVSSLLLNNLLRFQGRALLGMIGMTAGALINIALDFLFILVLHQGVRGASLATMISQTVSCIALFIICGTGADTVPILLRNCVPTIGNYKEIVRGGIPSLLRQTLLSLSTLLLNHVAGRYGDGVVAAMAIVNRVFIMASFALIGFGQGFQPVCGFNYGARRYDRVKRAFWFCVRVSTTVLTVLGIGCFIAAPGIIALFRKDDPEVIRIGAQALRIHCATFPLAGWIVLNNMMLQTMGKAVPASILALARQGLFLIPLMVILVPALGVLGIQLCIPITDLCTFILALPLGISVLHKDLGSQQRIC